MLSPEFLTAEGLPHALRSIGNLPAVFIFSALTFNFFLEKAEKHGLIFRKVIFSLTIFMLAVLGVFNTLKYHYFWANKIEVANSFNKNLTDISHYVKTLPPQKEKYIITSYNTLAKLPIYILNADDPSIQYFYPNELDKIKPVNPDNAIIIFIEKNNEAIAALNQRLPLLLLEEIKNKSDSVFYILK
jgi:hypothetical protein